MCTVYMVGTDLQCQFSILNSLSFALFLLLYLRHPLSLSLLSLSLLPTAARSGAFP